MKTEEKGGRNDKRCFSQGIGLQMIGTKLWQRKGRERFISMNMEQP